MGENMIFSDNDIAQIKNHGLTVDAVNKQIADFVHGFDFADILRPATVGDGILELNADARKRYIEIYDKYRHTHNVMTFVPASGAATRMFRDIYEFIETGTINDIARQTCENVHKFAFYNEMRLQNSASDINIAAAIVNKYGNMPKGLIPFHRYPNDIRTAAAEHLYQSAQYAVSGDGNVNMHFTVSAEHRAAFDELFNRVTKRYSEKFGVRYNITMSEQMSSTDTIAVNPDNTPFRTDTGALLFRPAGHGALIVNLNNIDADIIFIKNIDNVCHESNAADTFEYKCVLAGVLLEYQEKIFSYLNALDAGTGNINEMYAFVKKELGIDVIPDVIAIRKILNRPLRVCGMVRNTGAPGGGPFWVRKMGLQIVESAQIAPAARHIMNTATHFNPVDLVCATRDYMGHRFDLSKFVDSETGFISEKSQNGRPLRAMERPGLWNGAMADWNTVFVAVPGTTFTPVKTVADLLTPAHFVE